MKTAESTIQMCVDVETENISREIIEEMGLDMWTVIKMFLSPTKLYLK